MEVNPMVVLILEEMSLKTSVVRGYRYKNHYS